jgi:hypothetical protein
MIGFYILPPPAIIPTVALQFPGIVFLEPDGNLILVLLPSSECPTIVAYVPEHLEYAPLSPTEDSILQMVVPYGTLLTGSTFPTETVAFLPANKYCPE